MPFNIGPGELIIILVIALIVIGPGKLPEVGKALGRSIREFRQAATDVKDATSIEPATTPPPPPPAVTAPPTPQPVDSAPATTASTDPSAKPSA